MIKFWSILILLGVLKSGIIYAEDRDDFSFPSWLLTTYQGIPNLGYIDSFHVAHDDSLDELDRVFYLIRHQKTVQFLRARKAYQEIVYALNENSSRLDFSVPKDVHRIFNSSEGMSISNIVSLINQLENDKLTRNDAKIEEIFETMARLSTILVENDQNLNLLLSDKIFSHPYILDKIKTQEKNFIKQATTPYYNPVGTHLKNLKYHAKKKVIDTFRKREDVQEITAKLLGVKSFILKQYPLLSIKIKNEEFYKVIYSKLQHLTMGQFPIVDEDMDVGDIQLTESIFILSTSFLERQEKVWAYIHSDKENWSASLREISEAEFNLVLQMGLDNNTYWLNEINSEVKSEENRTPFIYMASDKNLWNELPHSFPFINKKLWDKAEKKFIVLAKEHQESQEFKTKALTYSSYALGAIGIPAMFIPVAGLGFHAMTRGASLLLKASSSTLNTAAVGLFIGAQAKTFYHSKIYADYSTKLFSASNHSGDYLENEKYIAMKESDYTALLYSSILSVGIVRSLLMKAVDGIFAFSKHGKNLIAIPKTKYRKLKYAKASQQNLRKSFYVKNKVKIQKNKISKEIVKKNSQELKEKAAENAGISVSELKKRYFKSDFHHKHFAAENRSIFFSDLTREISIDIGMILTAEYMVRGDAFWDELPFVFANTLLTIGIVTVIVSKNFRPQSMSVSDHNSPKRMFDKNLSFRERKQIFKNSGKELALYSLPIMAMASGLTETYLYNESKERGDDPDWQDHALRALYNTLFTTLFLGLTTPIRSQAVFKANEKLTEMKVNPLLQKSMIWPLSTVNNLAGNYSYVYLSKELGIQNSEAEIKELPPYYYNIESNQDNSKFLFPNLEQ